MKDKEKIFELLREAAETPDEERYVEDLIRKVNFEQPEIIEVDECHVKFDGRVFRKDTRTGYYEANCSLHREIWRFFHGEIPKGYEVHHRDLNRSNNDITNFDLLTKAEHKKIHVATLKTFKCQVCGRKFKAGSVSRYCSKECRKEGVRRKYLKKYTCEYCGREFEATRHYPYRFCSKVCAGLANRKITRETITCAVCGKKFTAKACAHRKYCSLKCYHEAHSKGSEIKTCPVCGKEFKAKISAHSKYCSRKCYNNRPKKH